MNRVAVVGASTAGLSAAATLRERGFAGEITLVDADPDTPYDRPPLSKQLLLGDATEDDVALRPAGWFEEQGLTLRLGERVAGLDAGTRTLRLADGRDLPFDGLVIASGSSARTLALEGAQQSQVRQLRTLDDARRLRAELIAGRRLVVIGGGFIGLEVAATARRLGLDVTVLEAAATPVQRSFGPAVGGWFVDLHRRYGVEVRCGVELAAIETTPAGCAVRLADGTRLAADLVLAGVGAAPSTDWLRASAVQTDNGVVCRSDLSTGVPDVVAAGDVARWHNPLFDSEMRVEHWTNAVEQGRHAAATLLGEREPFCPVPYFWTDQYDAKVRFVGQAAADDEFAIDVPKPGALVALYGRGGVLRGAVCVNSPRRLAQYRQAIQNRMPWDEARRGLVADRTPPVTADPAAVATHSGGNPP